MLVDESKNAYQGLWVCGKQLEALNDEMGYAIYERNGRACGVTFGVAGPRAFVQFCPAVQLPPFARNARAWSRRMWDLDDDRATSVKLDVEDGEITYRYTNKDLLDSMDDAVVGSILDFLLGDEFHEAVVDVVRYAM